MIEKGRPPALPQPHSDLGRPNLPRLFLRAEPGRPSHSTCSPPWEGTAGRERGHTCTQVPDLRSLLSPSPGGADPVSQPPAPVAVPAFHFGTLISRRAGWGLPGDRQGPGGGLGSDRAARTIGRQCRTDLGVVVSFQFFANSTLMLSHFSARQFREESSGVSAPGALNVCEAPYMHEWGGEGLCRADIIIPTLQVRLRRVLCLPPAAPHREPACVRFPTGRVPKTQGKQAGETVLPQFVRYVTCSGLTRMPPPFVFYHFKPERGREVTQQTAECCRRSVFLAGQHLSSHQSHPGFTHHRGRL